MKEIEEPDPRLLLRVDEAALRQAIGLHAAMQRPASDWSPVDSRAGILEDAAVIADWMRLRLGLPAAQVAREVAL